MLLIRNCNTYPALKQLLVKGTELSYQLMLIKIHSIDWGKDTPWVEEHGPHRAEQNWVLCHGGIKKWLCLGTIVPVKVT